MPTDAYLAKAKQPNRKPVVLASIESVDAVVERISAKSEWDACSLTNLSSRTILGAVTPTTDAPDNTTNPYSTVDTVDATASYSGYDGYNDLPGLTTNYRTSVGSNVVGVTVYLKGRSSAADNRHIFTAKRHTGTNESGQYYYYTTAGLRLVTFELLGKRNGGAAKVLATKQVNFESITTLHSFRAKNLTSGQWSFALRLKSIESTAGGGANQPAIVPFTMTVEKRSDSNQPTYDATSSLISTVFDLGSTPTIDSIFRADDTVPSGATLSYTIEGSSDASVWSSLGAIGDGDKIQPFRYYRVTASFTSTDFSAAVLKSLEVSGGDSQFLYFSTEENQPAGTNATGVLDASSVGALKHLVDFDKPSRVGKTSIKLFWKAKSGDMLAKGYLSGKRVTIQSGFNGLALADFETVFAGRIESWSTDNTSGTVTLSVIGGLSRFSKIKLPSETFSSTGAKTTTPLSWSNEEALQVIIDLIDEIGIPDSEFDRAAFEAILNEGNSQNHPASMDLVVGTLVSGDVTDLETENGTYLNIGEVSGTPGFTLKLNFSDIAGIPDAIDIYGRYQGNAGHNVDVDIYNYNTSSWDNLGTLPSSSTDSYHKFTGIVSNNIGSGGVTQLRIKHTTAGNASHDLYLDHIYLSNFEVTRTISEPKDAFKLIGELQEITGTFVFEGPDGRITASEYDKLAPYTVSLDADDFTQTGYKTNDGEIVNSHVLYYSASVSDPSDDSADYSKGFRLENYESQTKRGHVKEDIYYDKWGLSSGSIKTMAYRLDSLYSSPRGEFTLTGMPIKHIGINPGDTVFIDNISLPRIAGNYQSKQGRVCLVKSRSVDPIACTISLDLIDIRVGDSVATNFGSDTVGQNPTGFTLRWDAISSDFLVSSDATALGGKVLDLTGGTDDLLSVDSLDGEQDIEILSKVWVGASSSHTLIVRGGVESSGSKTGIEFTVNREWDAGSFVVAADIACNIRYLPDSYYYGFVRKTIGNAFNSSTPIELPQSSGGWVWLRVRANGSVYSARAWEDGVSEPDNWHMVTDNPYESWVDGDWSGIGPGTKVDYVSVAIDGDTAELA